jgi:hypothetical protein
MPRVETLPRIFLDVALGWPGQWRANPPGDGRSWDEAAESWGCCEG